VLLFINLAPGTCIQNGDRRFGFHEQYPEAGNAKAFCSAARQLDHIVCQRCGVSGLLVDLRPDLLGAVAVSPEAPKGDPRIDNSLHKSIIS
jgi:hypothetical protein